MATQIQFRRGTTSGHSSFTGAAGELTIDTDKDTIIVHDGSTTGGANELVTLSNTQTLTNKTLTSPTLSSPNMTSPSISGTAVTATAAEINTLDGITATVSELNIMDGVTATTAEINKLDGVTATATELNYVDITTLGTSEASKAVTADSNGDVTLSADLSVGTDLSVGGNTVITGNLTVNGSTVTNSADNLVVNDALIELNNGATSNASDLGLIMERGSTGDNAFIGWDESADKFKVGTTTATGASTGDLTVTTGTMVANIEGNVTGNVTGDLTGDVTGNADTATTLATARTIAGQSFDGSANISIAPTDLTGVTATAAEINALDGITATVTELNYTDGVTSNIQTQLNTKLASSSYTAADVLSKIKTVDGAGSGLDADTLDGVSSASFLRSDAADTKTSGTLTFNDSVKAIFGTSNDGLEIYHNGTHSYISDQGTGSLFILGSSTVTIGDSSGYDFISCVDEGSGGYVRLNHQNNAERLRTTSGGIDVTGTVTCDNTISISDGTTNGFIQTSSGLQIGCSSNHAVDFYVNNSNEFRMETDGDFHADGDVIAYSTTISDERLKTNIQTIDNALEKVNALRGVTFHYTMDGRDSAGLIAQDVEKVLPSAIRNKKLSLKQDDGIEYKTLQYDQTIGLLVEAIKELTAEVNKLKGE